MIGDAVARGKRGNTQAHGPEFKQKNSKGQSFKTVTPAASDGGGDHEQKQTAKRMNSKGQRPGVGIADRQAPHKQQAHKGLKHVDQGQIIDEWCAGKRGSYK